MGSIETRRNISVSIHEYSANWTDPKVKLCTIYDSNTRIFGQAYDIEIKKEANGWKE